MGRRSSLAGLSTKPPSEQSPATAVLSGDGNIVRKSGRLEGVTIQSFADLDSSPAPPQKKTKKLAKATVANKRQPLRSLSPTPRGTATGMKSNRSEDASPAAVDMKSSSSSPKPRQTRSASVPPGFKLNTGRNSLQDFSPSPKTPLRTSSRRNNMDFVSEILPTQPLREIADTDLEEVRHQSEQVNIL